MRTLAYLCCSGIALWGQVARVGVDSRVELFSIIFRLAGANEYSNCRVPAYDKAIDAHFGPYRDHEAVKLARQLRATNGVSFDAVMNMAIRLTDSRSLKERVPLDDAKSGLDARWKGAQARPFLAAARQFVADARFEEFWKAQQPLVAETDARVAAFLEKNADIGWFGRFFGTKAQARFYVAPGLTNGPSSFGPSFVAEDGVLEVYAIPGVYNVDGNGMPVFDATDVPTLVHEFIHAFANPFVDRHYAQLGKSGDSLFAAQAALMRMQAYGNGRTVLYESMVRAVTAKYVAGHLGDDARRRAIASERGRGFLWVDSLVDALDRYSNDRAAYDSIDAFAPEIVGVFETSATNIETRKREYDEARPKVVWTSIRDGQNDVDPATTEIQVKFDRPMRKNLFTVTRYGAMDMPRFAQPRFDETGTLFSAGITLEPGRQYAFSLNAPAGGNFQSADGIVLKQVPVKFRTRQAPAKEGPP